LSQRSIHSLDEPDGEEVIVRNPNDQNNESFEESLKNKIAKN